MKRTFFSLASLGLAACHAVTLGPAPLPASARPTAATQSEYRAIGTEPFWDLVIGHDLVFTDRGTGVSVVEQAPPNILAAAKKTYRGGQIEVTIAHTKCSDGMSDRVYPDTVTLRVEGRPYRGCGAPAAFFARAN